MKSYNSITAEFGIVTQLYFSTLMLNVSVFENVGHILFHFFSCIDNASYQEKDQTVSVKLFILSITNTHRSLSLLATDTANM